MNRSSIKREAFTVYAVTDPLYLKGRSWAEMVKPCLEGGVGILQMRDKRLSDPHFSRQTLKEEWKEVQALCKAHHCLFLINDDVCLAKELDADGVHLGQVDMKLTEARAYLGDDKIIGLSVHNLQEAKEAEKYGADYLGCGAVFPTQSKLDVDLMPHSVLKEICQNTKLPVVAIGGIGLENLVELKGSGIAGVAVISVLFGAEDVKDVTQKLKQQMESIRSTCE